MQAIVVYESHWGSTAQIARAIAEGIGPDARALTTSEATPDVVAEADLVIAGSPVMAFGLPSEGMIANAAKDSRAPVAPDVSQPSLRSWLEQLRPGHAQAAAFETRLGWSPLGATGAIDDRLRRAGYQRIAKPAKFVVKGPYGPLREGEVERARAWGTSLAAALG